MTPTTERAPAVAPDVRLTDPEWGAAPLGVTPPVALRLITVLNLAAAVWYFAWLLTPVRIGTPWLYGLLLAAELFNVSQAMGFWWTTRRQAHRRPRPWGGAVPPTVDVLVPTLDEPVEVVEPVLVAARRLLGARVRVALLDDGDRPEMATLARRLGVHYLARAGNDGAKAGNINAALACTDGEFVVVLDCDHVPHPDFLRATLGHLETDDRLAFVQTPQHYANKHSNRVAAASWAQQALFFGAIGRGKDRRGAMFCCGTNVVFRRAALADVGGFPTRSVTEDFLLSVRLHERGWRSAYLPEVLAQGLGPEDMASYAGQQLRWARGCLAAIPVVLRARLPWRLRLQYLLSATYFLTGWTVLVYMALPVVRILTGLQPLAATTADQFLLHFAPYFGLALLTVVVAGGGRFTFDAFAQAAASFWVHVAATVKTVLRLPGRFVVTPKQGATARQPGAVWPALLAIVALLGAAVFGLVHHRDAAMLNNVAFAVLHVCVLAAGAAPALAGGRRDAAAGVSAQAESARVDAEHRPLPALRLQRSPDAAYPSG